MTWTDIENGDTGLSARTEINTLGALVDTLTGVDGWVTVGDTWTYSAWDDTNGVSTATITVPTDATTVYTLGMRIKFTQSTGGTKYGIITKITATVMTAFINTDYALENEAITSPCYSREKVPFGFVLDSTKYSVITSDVNFATQASPTQNVWYNVGTITIDIPVGLWNIEWFAISYTQHTAETQINTWVTLSTANNSESDSDNTSMFDVGGLTSASLLHFTQSDKRLRLNLSAKDTYYLNTKTATTTADTLGYHGGIAPTKITAVCASL